MKRILSNLKNYIREFLIFYSHQVVLILSLQQNLVWFCNLDFRKIIGCNNVESCPTMKIEGNLFHLTLKIKLLNDKKDFKFNYLYQVF